MIIRDITIQVFSGRYNFIVRIGGEVYEMNADANKPNGVNMYLGTWEMYRNNLTCSEKYELPLSGDLPMGLVKGIMKRFMDYIDLMGEEMKSEMQAG